MAAKSGVMLGGTEGPASACLFALALLRVETIFREKMGTKGVRLVPHGGRQLFLQRTNKIGQAQASPYHVVRYLLSWPLLG